jgi:3-oxoacyl-[acyl-carrier protein] reductase
MDLMLRDKVVVITGASGGIGRALAEQFHAEGARLVLMGNSAYPALEALAREQRWSDHLLLKVDSTDADAMMAACARAAAHFGRLDVCIANAGRWTPEFALVHHASAQRIQDNIATNLLGSMWTARGFFAALERSGPRADGHGASLVFIGSTAGRFGEKGHAEYAASKAAMHGLMMSLKNEIVELDPYGRVNLVEPGWTVTHMARAALDTPGVVSRVVRTMPLRQLARAMDVARVCVGLSSPAMSRHLSGQTLTVAGGMEGRTLWDADQVDEAAIRARARSTTD